MVWRKWSMVVLPISTRAMAATRPSQGSWNSGSSTSIRHRTEAVHAAHVVDTVHGAILAHAPTAVASDRGGVRIDTTRSARPTRACHEGRSLRCGGPGRAAGRRYRVGWWCSSGSQRVSFVTVAFVTVDGTDRPAPTLGEDVETSWSLSPLARARPPPRTIQDILHLVSKPRPRLWADAPAHPRKRGKAREHEVTLFDYEVLSAEHARRVEDPSKPQRRRPVRPRGRHADRHAGGHGADRRPGRS